MARYQNEERASPLILRAAIPKRLIRAHRARKSTSMQRTLPMTHFGSNLTGGFVWHRTSVDMRYAPFPTFVDHHIGAENHVGRAAGFGRLMRFGDCVDDG